MALVKFILTHLKYVNSRGSTCPRYSQAAGSAVKTGLDYVGVGLSYAKNVRIKAHLSTPCSGPLRATMLACLWLQCAD